jgi:hypothetical protein
MKTSESAKMLDGGVVLGAFSCNAGDPLYYPGLLQDVPFYFEPYTVYYSKMTPNSSKDHRNWKSFEHYKAFRADSGSGGLTVYAQVWEFYPHIYQASVDHVHFGYDLWNTQGVRFRPFGDPGRPSKDKPGFCDERGDGGFVPAPSNLDELNQRALNSMMPQIKAELSLPNSIYELKDFKSLPHQIHEAFELTDKLSRILKVSFKGNRKTLRELTRQGAGAYLQYMFNLAPLLKDIHSIQAALSQTEKRVNDLVSRVGKPQRKHFMFSWKELEDTDDTMGAAYSMPPGSLPGPGQLNTFSCHRIIKNQSSVFHAEVEFNYNFSGYQTEHAQLLGMLDALGVNLNPRIIWNAIPWSFVIDWVAGVGQWLDQFKVQNLKPIINIRKYCWSITRSRDTFLWKVPNKVVLPEGPIVGQLLSPVMLPAVHESAYRRGVEMPGSSSIQTSGLSSTEFSLGGALVVSRRRHSSRR